MSPKTLEEEGETAAALSQDPVVTVKSLCQEMLLFFFLEPEGECLVTIVIYI